MSEQTSKQAIQQQFGGSAAAYVASAVHASNSDLQRMVTLAELRGDERVLDIATGGGHVALAFAPWVRAVLATDLTPAMLAAAARFAAERGATNVRFEVADAEALPYEDNSFDVVTCRVAAHHFGDVPRFVREAVRLLRPGGVLLLDDTIAPEDPTLDRLINALEVLRDPTHVRDYTVSEWRGWCEAAGVQVDSCETFRKVIHFDDWCRRARVRPETHAELTRRLRDAPAAARSAFNIVARDGEIAQFELHSVLLRGRKR